MAGSFLIPLSGVVAVLVFLGVLIRMAFKPKIVPQPVATSLESHQQEDIFNISSRVQGQEQWPTHEAHLSIDHINIMNELNKPPSYQDDAPPSYEEAMRLAAAKQQGESSSVAVIVVAPKPSTTN
ncbi:uncharacterized protein isoform X6 [Leptinotarsa decemlineata]|uniref:uncharacterized protein isoform X6 n=1 Tax=Leptinotarsa decemlineata TaxID=7539 RepID=UPI003D303E6B